MSELDEQLTDGFVVSQQQLALSSNQFKQQAEQLLRQLEDNSELFLSAVLIGKLQRRILLIQQILNQDQLNLQRKSRQCDIQPSGDSSPD
jgi:hypothetical protein